MKCKNTIAMVLAGAMLLPSNAFAADLSQYKDFPNDWSAKSLEQAIDDGLLNGSNGMIDAKGLLTRAQMAAIVSRSFGAAKTASLDDYRDVLPSAWYYSDMGKAVKMGAFQGANGLLNPDAPITREEAFTVLARAFALEGGGSATLKDFVDGGTVSSWASESVAALVAGGYVNGANGMLNLKNNITRAEFAKVITGMAASYVGAEGVSGKTVEGNVIVRESGASLSGMTINGDLIIADSADKVSLDNVKVIGRIVIRGGADAVGIKNTTAGKGVLVSSPNGAAAISVSGGSVGTVTAKSDLSLSGSVSNVAVTDKATLTVEKNASVGTVTVSAAGSKVTGDGKVTNVQANANNVTVTSKGAKVTAGSGVSGVKAGDKAVDSGKTETVGTASSGGGSSSGGSSSSRSDYSYVLMNIPYDEFYKAELSENAPAVDAVSSATKNKTRNGSLAGGSYHVNRDGSDITGVTYPVRVKTSDLSGLKQVTDSDSVSITVKNKKNEDETSTYIGKDALFESASYSYYALSDTPSYYKEATLTNGKWSFGKATGAASEATATIAKFKAPGHHANYEMEIESDKIAKGKKVYAVVLTATDGTSCGLHHVTEIWHVTKLGFKADPALVGKNISAVTYYTDDGIIKLNLAKELHVPYIAEGAKAEVAKSDADAKSTTLTLTGFPEDFKQEVKVPDGMTYSDGKITFGSAQPGSYTVTVSDAKKKYAPVSTTFVLSTDTAVAGYNDTNKSLVKATDASDTAFANYLKNITSVKIGETTYNVSDKGAVKIIKDDGSIDENVKVNGKALFADGQKRTLVISATGYPALSVEYTPTYTYAYAAVPYDEYWRSEGVYLSGDNWAASNSEQDSHKEYDKGAFDAVSRATTMHGRHRGSFQQNVVIDTKDNNKYTPVYWIGADTAVVSTGEQVTLNKTNIQDYKICGIKYVPVKVLSSDFTAFSNKYTVTQNGETLAGGFAEGVLKTYNLTAAVDADTNGLKAVTKNEDGTFTFAARQIGTGSGIKGEKLATAADIVTTPARNDDSYGATGSYGETVRVNLTGDGYGALGDKMQTVLWEYYGSDSTRTNKVATYGTKFAADNWMHKSMGIQLGLTDSLRCNVSETEGKGIGYWKVTVYALGYADYSTEFEITTDNLPKVYGPITGKQKAQLKTLADKAQKYLDNDATIYPEQVSKKTLQDHYKEATEMLQDTSKKENEAAELITELTGYLDKMDAANASTKPTTRTETGSATVGAYGYDAQVTVTFGADGKVISVDGSNTVPGGNSIYWNLLAGTTNAKNNFWTQFNGLDKAGIEALKVNPTGMTPNTGDDNADAVSGATYSSKAVKDAILNALSK
nr:penicillin-binding Tp47 domain C-containing protein [uncultured Agathobaculum sp.]